MSSWSYGDTNPPGGNNCLIVQGTAKVDNWRWERIIPCAIIVPLIFYVGIHHPITLAKYVAMWLVIISAFVSPWLALSWLALSRKDSMWLWPGIVCSMLAMITWFYIVGY